MPKSAAQLDREIAEFLKSGSRGSLDLDTIQKHVTERRARDPGAWSSRDKLVAIARAAAGSVFRSRKAAPSDAAIKKAETAAFNAIRRYDPLAGTADHPAAAYSHGVAAIAAEGVAQAVRDWVPDKKIPYGAWAKAGAKLVSHDKRFTIMKSNGGYTLLDLDTYNEYEASSLEEAKSKASQISRSAHAVRKKRLSSMQKRRSPLPASSPEMIALREEKARILRALDYAGNTRDQVREYHRRITEIEAQMRTLPR